jgi:hypothetical protein
MNVILYPLAEAARRSTDEQTFDAALTQRRSRNRMAESVGKPLA